MSILGVNSVLSTVITVGITQPINLLTTKAVKWQYTYVEQQTFEQLKDCLMEALISAYPDLVNEYILDTDANDHKVGTVLSRVQDGHKVVVAYYSKAMSAPEINYCTTSKEFLPVVKWLGTSGHICMGEHSICK